jgi:hypothetical protein
MRRMRTTALVLLLVACGHAPPKPPPPVEKPVTSVADLAGSWVTDDDLGQFYTLVIDAKGGVVQTIDRGKLHPCEQKGTLKAGDNPKTYALVFAKNTCGDESGDVDKVGVKVMSFTGKGLTLVFAGKATTTREYHRDPKSPAQ